MKLVWTRFSYDIDADECCKGIVMGQAIQICICLEYERDGTDILGHME